MNVDQVVGSDPGRLGASGLVVSAILLLLYRLAARFAGREDRAYDAMERAYQANERRAVTAEAEVVKQRERAEKAEQALAREAQIRMAVEQRLRQYEDENDHPHRRWTDGIGEHP